MTNLPTPLMNVYGSSRTPLDIYPQFVCRITIHGYIFTSAEHVLLPDSSATGYIIRKEAQSLSSWILSVASKRYGIDHPWLALVGESAGGCVAMASISSCKRIHFPAFVSLRED